MTHFSFTKALWVTGALCFTSCATLPTAGISPGVSRETAQTPDETTIPSASKLRLPPETLYHWGKQETLLKDVAVRTIPISAWEEFIMGNGTRKIGLRPYRRGFYGVIHPALASFFADRDHPWFVAVRIKPECRIPEQVAVISELGKNQKFKKWFKGAKELPFKTIGAYRDQCDENFQMGQAFLCVPENEGSCETDGDACDATVNRFFKEAGIKMVLDEGWPENDDGGDTDSPNPATPEFGASWYIRDRSCIERIIGTPHEELQMIRARHYPDSPSFWEYPAVTPRVNRPFDGSTIDKDLGALLIKNASEAEKSHRH